MELILEVVCPELSLRERPSLAAPVVATLRQHDRALCLAGEVQIADGYLWRQTISGAWLQVGAVDYKGDVIRALATWVDARG